ncbi:Fur family transcriptional regulator [Pectinatus sottacetonis]|uniref:Fur family transcriptional regulator n=1 Tax=Pectinatus sottacetonis TaxID=1002795 RepID=UPI0018C84565|nr:Fur family transcriptional regulator [Pectinatus sottacetonis]
MGDYKEYLNKNGMKSTKQRNLLLTILKNSENPQTAENIYLLMKKNDSLVNLSTVYRILEKFTAKAITVKTSFFNEKSVYGLKPVAHRHQLICLRCKKVIFLKNCPLYDFEKEVEQDTQFSVVSHRLELYGYCRECQKIIAGS